MRVRTLSSLLGAALAASGLTALVAPSAAADSAMGARLFLHGTSATFAQDSVMDPLAWEGYAPTGVTADTTPPTGTTSKTGLTFEPGGDPGLPMAPTFALGLTGSLTSACVDVFVEAEIPGESFPVFVSFGSGSPADGHWVYPDPVSSPGTGIVRITTMITLEAAFTLPDEATVFFHINGFDPTPDQRPYTLYYDSIEHPSNVTLNPTGPCTPAVGSAPAPAPAPAPSGSAAPSASAAPSESATASAAPSAEPSSSASESSSPTAAPAAGSCGDGTSPSAGGSASASAGESAGASASASPSEEEEENPLPITPPAQPAPAKYRAAAAQEPARDETSCRVTSITLSSNATQITAGNAPMLSGVARDGRGDAVEGATVTIYTKGYGESAYTAAATVKTDSAGQYKLSVRPSKQTALGANVGGARSKVITIEVSTRVNIAQPRPGTTSRDQTFTGNLSPGYARVAVGLGYVVNGRFVVLTQANTDGAGRYAIPARLPRGTYTFVVFTSAHHGTGKGSRSVRLTVR